MMKAFFEKIFLVLMSLFVLGSCGNDSSKPNVELIQDMMESPAIKAQAYDEDAPNKSGMRPPPEHTVPVGFSPYKYSKSVDEAIKHLRNPIAGKMTEDVLATGNKYFETQCTVCHGQRGEGSAGSSVASFMAMKPPSLLSDKVRGWTDAQIYHTITVGQGLMGPYASQVPESQRWALVNYVRHLQKENK
jgi:mono/diheme cytochrome c family protein